MSMKRYIAADFAPTNTSLKNNVPFGIKMKGDKVLDIYRAHLQINLTVGTPEVAQILAGLKLLDLPRITAGITLTDFAEEIQRRTWAFIYHVRYQAPAEAINDEYSWDFPTPLTVWNSPTFQYMYTGATTDFNNVWLEIQGDLRTPRKGELERLMIEQRQVTDEPMSPNM